MITKSYKYYNCKVMPVKHRKLQEILYSMHQKSAIEAIFSCTYKERFSTFHYRFKITLIYFNLEFYKAERSGIE